jgi:hypothetical protein
MDRLEIAALAMHALLSREQMKPDALSAMAVKYADALLYELSSKQPHKKLIKEKEPESE